MRKSCSRPWPKNLPAIALPKQFVVLGEFPKMGSGKIDFRTITETGPPAAAGEFLKARRSSIPARAA